MVVSLEPMLHHLPAWLMVMFRLTGLFFLMPLFSGMNIPARVKVFFAASLSFVIYPMLLTPGKPSAAVLEPVIEHGLTLWMLAPAIAAELCIGLAIGFVANLPVMGLQLGGHMIDQQMGLGLAGIFNPEVGEQNGIVSQFMFLLATVSFVILGGHRILVMALVGSFDSIPMGGFLEPAGLVQLIVGLMAAAFELGVRVSGPVLCLIFLQTVAMGFLARTVPQLNILSIGFVLRILAGAVILLATIGVQNRVFIDALRDVLGIIGRFFSG